MAGGVKQRCFHLKFVETKIKDLAAMAEYWATSRKVKKNKLLDTTHLGGAMNGSHGRTLEQLHRAVNDRV